MITGGPDTLLVKKVLENYAIPSLDELVPVVYSKDFTRDRIAEVAKLVFDAAEEGDETARQILTQRQMSFTGLWTCC